MEETLATLKSLAIFLNKELAPSSWAVTGSAALFLHFYANNLEWHRNLKDVDIVLFDTTFVGSEISYWDVYEFNDSTCTKLIGDQKPQENSIVVDVWKDFHFANVIPKESDIQILKLDGVELPVLKIELLLVLKYYSTVWNDIKHLKDCAATVRFMGIDINYIHEIINRSRFSEVIKNPITRQDFFTPDAAEQVDNEIKNMVTKVESSLSNLEAYMFRPLIWLESTYEICEILERALQNSENSTIGNLSKSEILLMNLIAPCPDCLPSIGEILLHTSQRRSGAFNKRLLFLHATFWGRFVSPALKEMTTRDINLILEGLRTDLTPLRFMTQLNALNPKPILS